MDHRRIELSCRSADNVNTLVQEGNARCNVVLCMAADRDDKTAVGSLAGARKVAWKHPDGAPVWAAVLSAHPDAQRFLHFVGGPTGHRLWSESPAGFTITSGKTHAEAYQWVVEHRTGHTYPITAVRMLRECGGIREGTCIDVGCGTGHLTVELAKRSKLRIIGLDVDPDMKPLFEEQVRQAGLQDRVSFVTGDAQKMPFPNDYADMIVSRGTLPFIPDLGKCLREVDRVLNPSGVAFLGGRYVYTPQQYKLPTEKLRQIVRDSAIAGAQVIEARGQWVKIVGLEAPPAARQVQAGPYLLAGRCLADYAITEGQCLLICRADGKLEQGLQEGFLELTQLQLTALYPNEDMATAARERIRTAKLDDRITCRIGDVATLPFPEASFDLVAGVGPMLIWSDRQKAMREIYRVLRPGGAALVGGRYLGMPDARKVSSQTLRNDATNTGIPSIRVHDDMGQWVEIRKGTKDRDFRD
ncbi:MAG: hypothetical protein A2V70_16910 [Planctomycetes bacterium RBG_13_63_9]|nr:MAG: hypothetical protein A2V70_16910 [Planctomycetes bacterium RBG_13_63_9]